MTMVTAAKPKPARAVHGGGTTWRTASPRPWPASLCHRRLEVRNVRSKRSPRPHPRPKRRLRSKWKKLEGAAR
ncbi:MAG: hypothetical protein ACLSVD_13365 [Eggerthellaceae bacterium]